MTRRFATTLAAVSVALLSTGTGVVAAAAPDPAPDVAVRATAGTAATTAGTTATTAGTAGTAALRAGGKAEVNAAYWDVWVRNAKVRPHWTGSVKGCVRGADSDRHRRATQRALGFVRGLAGLDGVRMTDGLGRKALSAALIMDANNALSHFPPKSWKCWTDVGATAAGSSNLHIQWGFPLTVGSVLTSYLGDQGASNVAVGHRRWLLYPFTATMGTGSTSEANAMWVFGRTDQTRTNPAYVGWPTRGWFPKPLEPHGRWSLSAGDPDTDFSSARVKVVRVATGKALSVRTHPVVDGYGEPTIVWEMPARFARTGRYRVTVTRIGVHGTSTTTDTSYVVRLFKPVDPR